MQLPQCVRRNELLSNHCTLKIGGPADFFAEPSSRRELMELLAFARERGLRFSVIGCGSNVLFDDEGFRGLIIKIGNRFSSVRIEGDIMIAQAGAWVPHIARLAQVNGLGGLEHTVGIPASIGGLVVMNGGSQRRCIGDNVIAVDVLDCAGKIKTIVAADCDFGYRKSIFQDRSKIILTVIVRCEQKQPKLIRKEMLSILRDRRHKFPLKEPNCGSVFKSDPEIYEKYGAPGKIIEETGFKGKSIGGIFVSDKHANFLVNRHNGSAKDFKEMVTAIEQSVLKRLNVSLHREVIYIHSDNK